jgi:hypothetical protein
MGAAAGGAQLWCGGSTVAECRVPYPSRCVVSLPRMARADTNVDL